MHMYTTCDQSIPCGSRELKTVEPELREFKVPSGPLLVSRTGAVG